MQIYKFAVIVTLALSLAACGGPLTNWLITHPSDGTTVKCTVEEGKTTKAQFEKMCGKALKMQSSRGCDAYGTDTSGVLRYCFKNGKLTKVLTTAEWLSKRGE